MELTAQELFRILAEAIERATSHGPDDQQYIERLIPELREATLGPNPPNLDTATPNESWNAIFGGNDAWKVNPILQLFDTLGLPNHWWRADDFYPESEYQHFSRNIWGTPIAGRETVLFNTGERFIALLIVIDPHTTYPLHNHRIE